jgi:hypothetical protein
MAYQPTTIGDTTTNGGGLYFDGSLASDNAKPMSWPDPKPEFRKSTNEIENKVWFELDVSQADIIVIVQDGKRVEINKKDFLQCIGLEW